MTQTASYADPHRSKRVHSAQLISLSDSSIPRGKHAAPVQRKRRCLSCFLCRGCSLVPEYDAWGHIRRTVIPILFEGKVCILGNNNSCVFNRELIEDGCFFAAIWWPWMLDAPLRLQFLGVASASSGMLSLQQWFLAKGGGQMLLPLNLEAPSVAVAHVRCMRAAQSPISNIESSRWPRGSSEGGRGTEGGVVRGREGRREGGRRSSACWALMGTALICRRTARQWEPGCEASTLTVCGLREQPPPSIDTHRPFGRWLEYTQAGPWLGSSTLKKDEPSDGDGEEMEGGVSPWWPYSIARQPDSGWAEECGSRWRGGDNISLQSRRYADPR